MEKSSSLPKCKFCTDKKTQPATIIYHYSGEVICSDCLLEFALIAASAHPTWRDELLKRLASEEADTSD